VEQAISAAEANRNFSTVLRAVREGGSYVVTSHGKPVARIVPAARDEAARQAAHALLLQRLAAQRAIQIGRVRRDELYGDEAA
jgi:prevent-host-death family protein